MFEFYDEPEEKIYNPKYDGITHINTYSKGLTELGRMLSNFYHSEFTHPTYGTFQSVEGFWYWYCTGQQHESLRGLAGYAAKKEGTKYEKDRIEVDPTFHDIVIECIALKICNNPDITQKLRDSTLPFVHYYFYGTVQDCKIHKVECDWMMDGITEIRNLLKE